MSHRRRFAAEIANFNHVATLTSEQFKACRPRVVALKGVRLRNARGVDRLAREVAGYLVVTYYNKSRTKVAKALSIERCTVSKCVSPYRG